jgi:putative adenylate-forming enzyme
MAHRLQTVPPGTATAIPFPLGRARIHALADEMLERERWPREQMRRYQAARLRELVTHAVAHSPWYRRTIGELPPGDVDLQALPVLDKETLIAQFDGIVADGRVRLAEAEAHLASDAAAEPLKGLRVVGTGGTTGRRSVVVYDEAAWETAVAALLRALRVQGIASQTRVLGIGAPTPLHMTNRLFAELGPRRADMPRVAVTTPLPELVDALERSRPDAVITYPSLIRQLAEAQLAGRLRIAPHTLSSVAETLTPDVRELARAAWGARVLNVYGATEVNLIAVECPRAAGLHVAEDLVIVEVVDADTRPVPPGRTGDKVLITTLFNRGMPFIRYELPDLVAVADGPCPCGHRGLRLAAVKGRQQDVLKFPARAGGEVAINAFLLGEALLHAPAIQQYQLTPERNGLRVRVVPRAGHAANAATAAAREGLERALEAAGAVVERLSIEPVREIARSGGGAKANIVSIAP